MANLSPEVYSPLIQRGVRPSEIPLMTERELLDEVLQWEGIIGYTDKILRIIDNIKHYKQTNSLIPEVPK